MWSYIVLKEVRKERRLSIAYGDGQWSAIDGQPDTANPHRRGSPEWQEWWLGYDSEERDYEQKQDHAR